MSEPIPPQQIQIKVNDDVLKGVYANIMQVAHTPEEFILDFMNIIPPTGSLNARVIISPGHMKRIVSALQENLKRYEEQFGAVKLAETPETPAATTSTKNHKFGFRTE